MYLLRKERVCLRHEQPVFPRELNIYATTFPLNNKAVNFHLIISAGESALLGTVKPLCCFAWLPVYKKDCIRLDGPDELNWTQERRGCSWSLLRYCLPKSCQVVRFLQGRCLQCSRMSSYKVKCVFNKDKIEYDAGTSRICNKTWSAGEEEPIKK